MNRRGFFKLSFGGVAAAAAVRTWPFRVYSFPSEVVVPNVRVPVMEHYDERGRTLLYQSARHKGWIPLSFNAYMTNPRLQTRITNIKVVENEYSGNSTWRLIG